MKIKKYFLIIFFLASHNAFAQFTVTIKWQQIKPGNVSDTIFYEPERKLNWRDFKGNPDKTSSAAAITESGFGYTMSMQSYNKKTNVVITVFCYFSKLKSWVKKDMDTDYALLHEQNHFNITYINAYLFIKKLLDARLNKNNYNYRVEKIHNEYFGALEKMQNDYDRQTSNGRIAAMQKVWNSKIDMQLAELITN